MRCMGIHPEHVPKNYACEQCDPRPFDREAAVQMQLLLKEQDDDTSSEEDDTPTSRKGNAAKRARVASSNSAKSEGSSTDHNDRYSTNNVYIMLDRLFV